MVSAFKIMLSLVEFINIVQYVYLLPTYESLRQLRPTRKSVLNNDENSGAVLRRIKRESVKVGWCPRGKEYYNGKCRTYQEIKQIYNNDYDDIVTEANVEKIIFPSPTVTGTETSTVALPEVLDLKHLQVTESKLDTNAMEIHAVSPTLIFEDESDAESSTNLIYTLLIACSCILVLIGLLKLLYDYYVRRGNTDLPTCSTCGSTSSRYRLCVHL